MILSKINDVLGEAVTRLSEETFEGKKGVWRTVKGNKIFFPTDGSKPTGMPDDMQGKGIEKGSKVKTSGSGGSSPKKKTPKKKKSSPEEIEKGKTQLKSKKGRKKAFGPKKKALEGAASGSGGAAVDDMASDGSAEEKDALDKLDNGEKMGKQEGHSLLSGGVKRAMMFGLGAALLGAFPAILGYAAAALIMKHAIGSAARRMGRMFEETSSPREKLAQAIEGGIKDAIGKLAGGETDSADLEKAIRYAENKSRGSGSNAGF